MKTMSQAVPAYRIFSGVSRGLRHSLSGTRMYESIKPWSTVTLRVDLDSSMHGHEGVAPIGFSSFSSCLSVPHFCCFQHLASQVITESLPHLFESRKQEQYDDFCCCGGLSFLPYETTRRCDWEVRLFSHLEHRLRRKAKYYLKHSDTGSLICGSNTRTDGDSGSHLSPTFPKLLNLNGG